MLRSCFQNMSFTGFHSSGNNMWYGNCYYFSEVFSFIVVTLCHWWIISPIIYLQMFLLWNVLFIHSFIYFEYAGTHHPWVHTDLEEQVFSFSPVLPWDSGLELMSSVLCRASLLTEQSHHFWHISTLSLFFVIIHFVW